MIRRIDSAALLVRSVSYGESDIIATFFTRENGKLSAIVRGARKSTKRFAGALEPIHGLMVTLEDKGKELCVLKEARIHRPRTGISASLEAMEAAGQALRWVRHLCPARTPEPAAWGSLEDVLEALDTLDARQGREGQSLHDARRHLAIFGLRLLTDMGYALELDRCIRCGRACPEGRSAFLDAAGGGLVCTSCGGARRTISGELRALATRAQRGEAVALSWETAREIIEIAEEAMAAHADFDPNR
ncbi:MAG: recombination and repair protein RecO [Labilithrix sp.]|nr:recombination and repair protein RecO [Labilithrix sp.]